VRVDVAALGAGGLGTVLGATGGAVLVAVAAVDAPAAAVGDPPDLLDVQVDSYVIGGRASGP
jgi:hypothetical protein